ncbi:hypothetical protein BGX21_010807 [Mortierella sp. AD011]|nr:hypothetical protein BGX20_000470 [Mortierella sp. AD010]KAF9393284.1 hypothetical protein BGX21_010807 [Mortierella sp. AD011]
MQLPEILDVIFMHLPLYTLTSSASLVSKQWNAISRRHLNLTLRWFLAVSESKQRESIEQLSNVDVLYIQFYDDRLSKGCIFPEYFAIDSTYDDSWKTLSGALSTTSVTCAGNKIKKLVLNGDIRYKHRLYPLLPFLAGLTELRLEKIYDAAVDLYVIFSFCPHLQHLYLEARGNDITGATDQVFLQLLGSPRPENNTTPSSNVQSLREEKREEEQEKQQVAVKLGKLRLKSLAIHGLDYGMTVIEPVLRSCPEVTRVELTQWNRWMGDQSDAMTRSKLYSILNESCPLLNHVHIYLVHDKLTVQTALSFIDTFPQIHSLTFTTLDLARPKMCDIFFSPNFSSRLTTLEITQSFETEPLAHVLHRILCSTPTLEHLKAPAVRYWAEYMDFDGETDDKGQYRPDYCIRRSSPRQPGSTLNLHHPWISREIWACRGLKTLRMWIQGAKGDVRDTKSARIMFGYLATVCPDLREIHITRSSVNVTLEGGLCLLSPLKHLRRLEIETDAIPKLKRKDVFWLASCRNNSNKGKRDRFIQELGRRRIFSELKTEAEKEIHAKTNRPRYLPSSEPTGKIAAEGDTTMNGRFKAVTFEDVIASTEISSVVKVLEEREREENPCWPALELFALVVSRSGVMYLTRQEIEGTIRRVRSNMEIRSIFSSLDY